MEKKMEKQIETIILDSEHPAINYFIDKPRRLKYDEYNNKLYKIEWTEDALKLRHKKSLEKKKLKYRETHPIKEKIIISPYIKKKMDLIKKLI